MSILGGGWGGQNDCIRIATVWPRGNSLHSFHKMRSGELERLSVGHDSHVGRRPKCCRLLVRWDGEEKQEGTAEIHLWIISVKDHRAAAAIVILKWDHKNLLGEGVSAIISNVH